VLLFEKKVAGILLEVKGEADLMDYALIGIGVNLNNKVSQEPFEQKAISVSECLGEKVDRFAFLSSLLQNFEALYLNLSMQEILREWKSLSSTLGRPVKVRTLNESFEGVALDLDDDGALLVQTETGIRKVYSGDCFYLR
jgi:BirA family biotin operon repressor/biotin-[acetyl-CoA-carboxylase] ligase